MSDTSDTQPTKALQAKRKKPRWLAWLMFGLTLIYGYLTVSNYTIGDEDTAIGTMLCGGITFFLWVILK